MKERALQQTHSAISLPLCIYQKWKRDSSLLAKNLGVVCVAQAYGSQPSTFIAECLFVVAQLRDVLAAEDSSVVAKEGDHHRLVGPERAEPDSPSVRVGQDDFRELLAHSHRLPPSRGKYNAICFGSLSERLGVCYFSRFFERWLLAKVRTKSTSDVDVLVGTARFELATPCTPSKCATRLRYVPMESAAQMAAWGSTFRILH
jgi:hypothetical protein